MALTEDARNAIGERARTVTEKLKPTSPELDAQRAYPTEQLDALADAGLLGLLVATEHGGMGGDLTSLALACEAVGWANGSTGLCYLLRLCGTAIIQARA